jgi:capping protein (actin filament) muscle Z-line, alpha
VRKLLPDGLLTDPLTAGIARAFHAKGKVVSTPSGAKTVVCAQGEVDATHYIDTKSKTAFLFNHLTLASENDGAPAIFDQSLESKREAIQSTFDSRFTSRFPAEDSAVSVFSKDGTITIVIVAEKKNLRNFWSGKWTSIWNITFTGDVASIVGEVKVSVDIYTQTFSYHNHTLMILRFMGTISKTETSNCRLTKCFRLLRSDMVLMENLLFQLIVIFRYP